MKNNKVDDIKNKLKETQFFGTLTLEDIEVDLYFTKFTLKKSNTYDGKTNLVMEALVDDENIRLPVSARLNVIKNTKARKKIIDMITRNYLGGVDTNS